MSVAAFFKAGLAGLVLAGGAFAAPAVAEQVSGNDSAPSATKTDLSCWGKVENAPYWSESCNNGDGQAVTRCVTAAGDQYDRYADSSPYPQSDGSYVYIGAVCNSGDSLVDGWVE